MRPRVAFVGAMVVISKLLATCFRLAWETTGSISLKFRSYVFDYRLYFDQCVAIFAAMVAFSKCGSYLQMFLLFTLISSQQNDPLHQSTLYFVILIHFCHDFLIICFKYKFSIFLFKH